LETHGFKFARSSTQLILEMAYTRSPTNHSQQMYSADDLQMIHRSLNTMRGFLNMGLWDGSEGMMHFLGTASCMIKLQQPGFKVAVAAAHSIYLQKWREYAFRGKDESECDERHRLRSLVGSDLERALWVDTGMYGNGPWFSCFESYIKIVERNQTKPDAMTIRFLEELPYHHLMCDEIEEAMGGNAILSGHWKRRNTTFFDNLVTMAQLMNDPISVKLSEDARQMSHAMMHSNPGKWYKEENPKSKKELYRHVELNPEADAVDQERWGEMVGFTRHEQDLVPHFLPPRERLTMKIGIADTRFLCDQFASGHITMEEYMAKFFELKETMYACEKNDPRFQEEVPLPRKIPDWAIPALYTSVM